MGQQGNWNKRLKAVALGLGLALCALTFRHWFETLRFGHPLCDNCRPDFPQFYAAAKLVWDAPQLLYDETRQMEIQRSIDPRISEILPYTYPPITALVLLPLGRLSFSAAYAVMTAINLLLLALSLRLLIAGFQLDRDQSSWLILSALCSFGVHSVILQGQVSFISLLLLTIFAISVQDQRWFSAGLAAALSFVKPQLQAAPFFILLGRRRGREFALAAFGVIALMILSTAIVGWYGIGQYAKLLASYLTMERGYGSYPEAMHNLRALAQYIFVFPRSRYLWLVLTTAVIGAVIYLNQRCHTHPSLIAAQWIGNFSAGILIAPHLYPHDLAIMIVPTAFALKLFGEPVPIWLILLLLSLGIYPLLGVTLGNHLLPGVPLILLAVLFWCVASVRRSADRWRQARG